MIPIEILLIIEADIATTQLIEQLLAESKDLGLVYKKKYLAQIIAEDFSDDSIPLFIRSADSIAAFWMKGLRRIGKPYLYYIDDNFWLLDGETALAAYYRHPITRRSLNFAIQHACTVITNSKNLQTFIVPRNKNTVFLPPFFDFRLVTRTSSLPTDEYRIGFAGSPSRLTDLDILKEVIPSILNRHSNVVFEFIGCFPAWLNTGSRIRFFEHMSSYAEYISFQATRNWKIALAPLDDHDSNKYKTNNKYREYSAFRYAGVYSDSESYADSIKDGITGLIAKSQTAEDWISAINRYIENENLRAEIAQAAYSDAYQNFDISVVINKWYDLFVQTKNKSTHKKFDIKQLSNKPNLFSRLSHYVLLLEISMYEGGLKKTVWRIIRRFLRAR